MDHGYQVAMAFKLRLVRHFFLSFFIPHDALSRPQHIMLREHIWRRQQLHKLAAYLGRYHASQHALPAGQVPAGHLPGTGHHA